MTRRLFPMSAQASLPDLGDVAPDLVVPVLEEGKRQSKPILKTLAIDVSVEG